MTTVDTFMDLVRNLVPENLVQACLEKVQTVIKYPGATLENATIREDDKLTWKFEEKLAPGRKLKHYFVDFRASKKLLSLSGKIKPWDL